MTTYTYNAVEFQQQPGAPKIYMLSVPATQLLEWSDVPNAQADYMAGYQRVYNPDRAKDISKFLELDTGNILPGAIIVTVDSSSFATEATDIDSVCRVSIEVNETDFPAQLDAIHKEFVARLSEQERAVAEMPPTKEAEEDPEIDDAGVPPSYLAELARELRLATEDFDAVPGDRKSALTRYASSVSKPGLIIDGQHRVFGSKDVSSHDVTLGVVLVPGLPVGEQVFHFYVLNSKARPLKPLELRRTISTSLTNEEIENLWDRFEAAGVNPEQARWTHKMDTDPFSPFRGLIDFGLGAGGFIKENVAYQVVSRFLAKNRGKYRALHQGIDAWDNETDDRLTYFYSFWSAIQQRYADVWDSTVKSGGGQLLYKATMIVLQEYLLDELLRATNYRKIEGKPGLFHDLDLLEKHIGTALEYLPPEFFTREWARKDLDTNDGRRELRTTMQDVIDAQGMRLGVRSLFKAKK